MKNLQEATERICELKGNLVAVDALLSALLQVMPPEAGPGLQRVFEGHAELTRTVLLHAPISEHTIAAFEATVARASRWMAEGMGAPTGRQGGIEAVLWTSTRIGTFHGTQPLTSASGFFFERGARLYLVTSRHVLADAPSGHFPDRLEIELHTSEQDLCRHTRFSMMLHQQGRPAWRQGQDQSGEVDVAVLEIDRTALPPTSVLRAFTPEHLPQPGDAIGVGDSLSIFGFPLGFHDMVHHLPVVRQAAIASSFGTRFQGLGCFLTDGRTHRGSSGAPVLLADRQAGPGQALPWKLLGVHSTRMDMSNRDQHLDESLGLNCAWYADILMGLTEG